MIFILGVRIFRTSITQIFRFSNSGALTAMLRDLVLMKLGRCGDEATVKEARKRFEDHCAGTKTISADLRSTVCLRLPYLFGL